MWGTMSADPAVIGNCSMTYFASFAPVADSKLAQVRDFCAANAQRAHRGDRSLARPRAI